MIKYLFCFLVACAQDVSIIKVYDNLQDTSVDESTIDSAVSPDTDDSHTNDIDYTKVSGHVMYHFNQIACPACVGVASEFDINASVKLHLPTSGDYFDAYQHSGTCTSNIYDVYVGSTPVSETNPITLRGYQQDIILNLASPGTWTVGNLYESQYERQTVYGVETAAATIENAFITVEGFDWIEPYTLLWIDPSYAFETPIYRVQDTLFSWQPAIAGDQFEILIAAYTSDGSQFIGAVSCMEPDNGTMLIPGSYIQQFPQGSLVAVYLTRHRMGEVLSAHYRGKIQTHMKWTVIGTGHVQ